METTVWKDEARKALEHLQSVRDEVRVQLHLASMDAKTRWRQLEPRMQVVADRLAKEGSESAKRAYQEVMEEVKAFRESLSRQ